jgi:hypothetical protein
VTRLISSSLAQGSKGADDEGVVTAGSDSVGTDRTRTALYAAAFHGAKAPNPLLPVTDSEQLDVETRWLLGVLYGTLGHYHPAAELLTPRGRPLDSRTASCRASHLRQLSRHAEAEELDRLALTTAADADARADALIGLVADAVGAGDVAEARRRLTAAEAGIGSTLTKIATSSGWRAEVRLDWVRTEVALLGDDADSAVTAAARAVERSASAAAPRHLTKSRLFLGVATAVSGRTSAAVSLLRTAANAADAAGLVPLVWPSRLMLAQLLETSDPTSAARERESAASAIQTVIWGLPAAETATLLARPEIRPLVGAYDSFRTGSSHKVTRTDYSRHGAVSFTGVTDDDDRPGMG